MHLITLLCFFSIPTRIKVNLNSAIYRYEELSHFLPLSNATIYIRLIEQSVYQIDGIVLFLIDDFGIHLRHLHIGMTE